MKLTFSFVWLRFEFHNKTAIKTRIDFLLPLWIFHHRSLKKFMQIPKIFLVQQKLNLIPNRREFLFAFKLKKETFKIIFLFLLVVNSAVKSQVLNVLESHRTSFVVTNVSAFAADVDASMLVEILGLWEWPVASFKVANPWSLWGWKLRNCWLFQWKETYDSAVRQHVSILSVVCVESLAAVVVVAQMFVFDFRWIVEKRVTFEISKTFECFRAVLACEALWNFKLYTCNFEGISLFSP